MIAWAVGKATTALAVFMLDSGAATRCYVRGDTGVGYWTALNLGRKGYPYTVTLEGVTFTRRKAP